MSYAEEVPMGQGLDGVSGFRLKSEKAPHSTNFLSFQYPSVFRILPEMVDGKEVPWRLSTRLGDFSAWAKGVRIAAKIGALDRFTCIASPKGRASRDYGPIDLFHKAISDAVEQDPRAFPDEWKDWITYRKGLGAKLTKPEYYMLLQGALYEHGGKQFVNKQTHQWEPKFPSLLAMKTSARISLENLCNTDAQNWTGRPDDIMGRYMIGDVFSLAAGSAIRIVPVPDDGMVRAHYKVENMKTPIPINSKMAAENWWGWESLLVYLTEEEQIRNLERSFPPEAVDYVFARSPYAHLLSGHVRGTFGQKMAVQMQGPAITNQQSQFPPSQGVPSGSQAYPPVPVGSMPYPAASHNSGVPIPPVDGDRGPAGFEGNVGQFRMSVAPMGGSLGGAQFPPVTGGQAAPSSEPAGFGQAPQLPWKEGQFTPLPIGGLGSPGNMPQGGQVAPSASMGASLSSPQTSGQGQPVTGVNPSAVNETVDRLKAMREKMQGNQ